MTKSSVCEAYGNVLFVRDCVRHLGVGHIGIADIAKHAKTSEHMATLTRAIDSGPLTRKIRNPKYGNIGVVMKGIFSYFSQ